MSRPPRSASVLFALTHNLDRRYRHMIGRGKPFGAGQFRLGSLKLTVEANNGDATMPAVPDELFDAVSANGWLRPESHSLKPFLAEFVKHAQTHDKLRAFPNVTAVREWLAMADPANGQKEARAGNLAYQPVKNFGQIRKFVKPLIEPAEKPNAPTGRLLAAPK